MLEGLGLGLGPSGTVPAHSNREPVEHLLAGEAQHSQTAGQGRLQPCLLTPEQSHYVLIVFAPERLKLSAVLVIALFLVAMM